MFTHPDFDIYPLEEIPLECDLFLRPVSDIEAHEEAMLESFEGKEWNPAGAVCFVAATKIEETSVELSWAVRTSDRFHTLNVTLPKDKIEICVGSRNWDEDPSLFVEDEWLAKMLRRTKCTFALIDAIGVRNAIKQGLDFEETLPEYRKRIDELSNRYPQVSFISWADSIILKSHWRSGYFKEGIKYTYDPELFIEIFSEVKKVFAEVFGLSIYGVFTQGENSFQDELIHISENQNHICLNSLGAPFADLKNIEDEARKNIKSKIHEGHELYLDLSYFQSLNLKFSYKKHLKKKFTYISSIPQTESEYVCAELSEIGENLQNANQSSRDNG
tara:strand:+ start:248 stop:1240 length:993 start_codon:yes stop_codon:yes gene_type:complete